MEVKDDHNFFFTEISLHFHNLGVLYHRWHHYENAAEAYKRALVLDPKNKSTATNLKTVREMMKTAQEWLLAEGDEKTAEANIFFD